eukprot:Sdes_comp9114_c0_seq1m577
MAIQVTNLQNGVQVNEEWMFTSVNKNEIMNSYERNELQNTIKIPLPDMVFGKNIISLINLKNEFRLEFSAPAALALVDSSGTQSYMKVHAAEQWARTRATKIGKEKLEIIKPYDWTYTTPHKGCLQCTSNSQSFRATEKQIDVEKLKLP